jgi:hypothetical protein
MATKLVAGGEPVQMTAEEEAAFEALRGQTLPQAKRERREEIRRRRDLAELNFSYGGKVYSAAAAGRIAVLANAARASGTGFPVRFVAADDTETSLTRAEMQAFETALATHLQACSANSVTLRQAVNAAGDVAAVRAIDIEAGWP